MRAPTQSSGCMLLACCMLESTPCTHCLTLSLEHITTAIWTERSNVRGKCSRNVRVQMNRDGQCDYTRTRSNGYENQERRQEASTDLMASPVLKPFEVE